jgi:putative SOS response-associated peptidase YedK
MCGRYASARSRVELLEEFRVQRDRADASLQPDYNVAPTKPVYAVLTRNTKDARDSDGTGARDSDGTGARDSDGTGAGQPHATAAAESASPAVAGPTRELRVVRWGLVPFWAKDPSIGSRLINARAETVDSKPAFRRAFTRRRCLLPADGYYEWQARSGVADRPASGKQPYYICRADGGPLAFAGLYELWRDSALPDDHDRAWLWTATIITTSAPDDLGMIHDRMPMVIEPDRWAAWLDPANNDPAELRTLLAPAVAGGLTSYPVSTAVNSVRHNGPELIERAEPVPEAGTGPPGAASSRPASPGRKRSPGGAPRQASGSVPDKLF